MHNAMIEEVENSSKSFSADILQEFSTKVHPISEHTVLKIRYRVSK